MMECEGLNGSMKMRGWEIATCEGICIPQRLDIPNQKLIPSSILVTCYEI